VVKLLVENGADVIALTEGHPPFTTARLSGNNEVCDYLVGEMKRRQVQEPDVWIRARIRQLQSEIQRLERRLRNGETR
jgi:hypothetical protein